MINSGRGPRTAHQLPFPARTTTPRAVAVPRARSHGRHGDCHDGKLTSEPQDGFAARRYLGLAEYPAWHPTEKLIAWDIRRYQEFKYNLYRRPFDAASRQVGPAELVFDAAAIDKSATLPRISPDGRFLMFAMGKYGVFHIWHKDADLYLMDLRTRQVRPMTEINSDDVESYHTWSSNGRWVVFSSRRNDGNYTRPLLRLHRQGRARAQTLRTAAGGARHAPPLHAQLQHPRVHERSRGHRAPGVRTPHPQGCRARTPTELT